MRKKYEEKNFRFPFVHTWRIHSRLIRPHMLDFSFGLPASLLRRLRNIEVVKDSPRVGLKVWDPVESAIGCGTSRP